MTIDVVALRKLYSDDPVIAKVCDEITRMIVEMRQQERRISTLNMQARDADLYRRELQHLQSQVMVDRNTWSYDPLGRAGSKMLSVDEVRKLLAEER